MARSVERRLGVILVIVLLLSVLLVPAASAGGCGVYYRVQVGDTLTSIAAKYHVSIYAIAQANHIRTLTGSMPVRCSGFQGVPAAQTASAAQTTSTPAACKVALDSILFQQPGPRGAPVVQCMVPAVSFNWGWGAPAPGLNPEISRPAI